MSALIRPSFHALTLAMLACACALVAQTVNTVLSTALLPLPTAAELPPQAAPTSEPEASPALSAELLARYTGLTLGERSPEPPTEVSEDAPPTQLGLQLLGTMTSVQPGMSLATVYENTSQRTRTVWEGSVLQGAEVLAIERTRLVLLNAGKVEILEASSSAKSPALAMAAPTPPPAPAGPATGFGSSIRQTGPDAYTIERQDVENALGNMSQLFTQARVVPALKDGVAEGFKVFSMRQDSLFTRLGLQNGDVLRGVNGFMLDSPTRALEAFNHLRGSSRIEIQLERGGQTLRKTYSVQN